MEKKNSNMVIPVAVVACVLVGGISFWGGMKYQSSKNFGGQFAAGNFQNLTPEQRQQRFAQGGMMGGGAGRRGGMMGGANFVAGEVLSKDDKSVTVKLPDGGSKIIFLSATSKVMKSTEGSLSDIQVGSNISANGKANSDGSITAESLQLRPTAPAVAPATTTTK